MVIPPPPPPPPSVVQAVPPPPPPPPPAPLSPWLRRLLAYDSETALILDGIGSPDLVCGSTAYYQDDWSIGSKFLSREEAIEAVRSALRSDRVFTGANLAFDFSVIANECPDLIPFLFLAYDEARVFDVLLTQALDAVRHGHLDMDTQTHMPLTNSEGKSTYRYNLWNVTKMVLGRDDAKENSAWRMSYGLTRGFPLAALPTEATQYPVDDVKNPLQIAVVQSGYSPSGKPYENIDNLPEQAETAFALQLGGVRGIRTDRQRVEALRRVAQAKRDVMTTRYKAIGFLRPDGTEDQIAVKRAVAIAYGATGTCYRCGGSGRLPKNKYVPCRGEKVSGRYRGCAKESCSTCKGTQQVLVADGDSTCWMMDGGCDGTGLDVRTAPTLKTITTTTGRLSIARDTLSESGDETLHDYGESEHDKVLDTYLPFLEQGVDKPINLGANVILESTRASYSGVIQLTPQKGGVRECFAARDGFVFCSVDYSALELCTLSQICLLVVGYSRMAEVINQTKDPGMLHTSFGARMIGLSVEEMARLVKAKDVRAKNTRQAAKAGNFTFGGGGGAATTVLSNRAKSKGTTTAPDGFEYAGIRFCILLGGAERCGEKKQTEWGAGKKKYVIPPTCSKCLAIVQDQLRPSWYAEFPEMPKYFDWVTKTVGKSGRGVIPCFGKKFWQFDKWRGFLPYESSKITAVVTRGGVGFTDGANNSFQSLAAAGAKYALRKVTRECYLGARMDGLAPDEWIAHVGPERRPHVVKRRTWDIVREAELSPLRETRPLFFAHDEIFSEMSVETAHLAGPRKAEIMRGAMKEFVPDVFIGAEPALMKYWSKDADAVYDASGKLIPWEPKA